MAENNSLRVPSKSVSRRREPPLLASVRKSNILHTDSPLFPNPTAIKPTPQKKTPIKKKSQSTRASTHPPRQKKSSRKLPFSEHPPADNETLQLFTTVPRGQKSLLILYSLVSPPKKEIQGSLARVYLSTPRHAVSQLSRLVKAKGGSKIRLTGVKCKPDGEPRAGSKGPALLRSARLPDKGNQLHLLAGPRNAACFSSRTRQGGCRSLCVECIGRDGCVRCAQRGMLEMLINRRGLNGALCRGDRRKSAA